VFCSATEVIFALKFGTNRTSKSSGARSIAASLEEEVLMNWVISRTPMA